MGHLVMSDKERQRKAWMAMVHQGQITLVKAADGLGVSYRQAKRIYRRYMANGDAGLIHLGRHRQSNRRYGTRETITDLYKRYYLGFGPTLAAEKLTEQGYTIDHETLRRWLIAAGLWCKQRKRSPYRKRRERREQFGELIQIDGSIHDWFSSGTQQCLLGFQPGVVG